MRKSLNYKESFLHGKDSLTAKSSTESQIIHWTPELFGPVLKTQRISFSKSYYAYKKDRRAKIISTFVPDELIYIRDLSQKKLHEFFAVILLIEISNFHEIWDKFTPTENSASYGFNFLLNKYLGPIIENIYIYDGDVVKLEADGIFGVWKLQAYQSMSEIVGKVIKCGLKSQECRKNISNSMNFQIKLKMTISTGNVGFSVIGNAKYRKWVLIGQPIIEVELATKICNAGELILTKSTWQYVPPTKYEHVLVDSHNIKIVKEIAEPKVEKTSNELNESKVHQIQIIRTYLCSERTRMKSVQIHDFLNFDAGRPSLIDAMTLKLGDKLNKFLIPLIRDEIYNNRALELLTHKRRVSILSINIIPVKSSTEKLVDLCDKYFDNLYKLTVKYLGIINTVVVYPKRIFFSVYFGLQSDSRLCNRNGLICGEKFRRIFENTEDIVKLSIGISTGMVFCGVIGHEIRQSFICSGLACEKSEKIVAVASQYVNCDFDTVLYSDLSRNCFRLRSVKGITGFGKFHIYEFHHNLNEKENRIVRKIENIYPIIGCFYQLDKFSDILDDICVPDRTYCGVLIEGSDRVGKSRLLDECVLIAKSRQLSTCTVSLTFFDTTRAYNTIYHILLEILQIHDCHSVEQRKKLIIKKLGNVFSSKKFCYINVLLNVNFEHSSVYLSENEEQRLSKSLILFDKLLESVRNPTGIFIDDIHFMDLESWPFVSRIMNCKNYFLAMTVDNSKYTLSANHYNDSRLLKFTLDGLNPKEMCSLVCQLLNVHGVSKKVDKILNNANWINAGWCEAFISLTLERKWFNFYYHDAKGNLQDLISPPLVSVIKVPYGVFPEEINPHLPQNKLHILDIKVANARFMNDDTYPDIEIFNKKLLHGLTSYEQSVLRSAAVLGDIFTRETLENVVPNSIDFHTARAITRLMELRVLECASIQRFNYNLSPYAKRNTFSDMHHLVHCSCYRTNVAVRDEQLPSYAGCKLLEFKVKAFRRFVYDQILPSQKRELHSRAAEIYERQAKTCISCGGGSFLNILGVVQGIGADARALRPSIVRRSLSRDGIYFSKFKFRKRSSSNESTDNQEGIHYQKISILPPYFEAEEESQYSTDDMSTPSNKFKKKSEVFLLKKCDPSRRSQLKKFNLIDFRNCECENVLNGIFQELLWHLQQTDLSNKLVEYMMEYSAGLILICRYYEASNILIIAKEINDKLPLEKRWKNKYIIWGLMGDASVALGNISKAKKYFKEAIRLQTNDKHYDILCVRPKVICQLWHKKINRKFINRFSINRFTENEMSRRLVIAYHLMKLSKVFSLQGDHNRAELITLNALSIGLSSSEGFTQKCELYVKACEIFRACSQLETARKLDKKILTTINKKYWWAYIDEIVSVLRVFKSMFEIRLLMGEYRDALEIGVKLFKISKSLQVTAVQLEILPLLINLTIRMKRIYETADLMKELYYLSIQDIDDSSITWYYALSLDLALDAGMVLESFEKCAEHAKTILADKNKSCVLRDPESLKRLSSCLWIWQLRSGTTVTATFAQRCASYATNVKPDNYAQLLNLLKTLEAYFLVLRRCINIKRADELAELLENTKLILKTLDRHSNNSRFIKPRFYMFKAYLKIAHGDKHSAMRLLKKARKYASLQSNEMLLSWILLNEKMWKRPEFNNTTNFWMENVSCVDSFNWRDIHEFDVKAWSSILFFIPPPDSCL